MTPRRFAYLLTLLFIASLPWQDAVRVPGLGSFSKILGVAAFGFTALSTLHRSTVRLRRLHLMLVGLLLFVLYGAASHLWSVDGGATVSKTVTYAQLIAMVWLVWEHGRGERTRNELMQAYVIGGFVSVGLAFSALVGSAGFRQTGGINANDFAMVVVVGIPMAWHLVLRARRTVGARYWLNLAYIPTALVAIVLSASRGGLIMAIVALSVIALTFTRLGALRQTILLLVTVVGTWAVFTYLPSAFPDLQQNFERLAGTAGELREGTLSNRSLIWSSGLQAFAERPAFGYGLGAFREAVTPYYGRGASPHSSFLSVLVELGLLGLVVYVSLLVVAAAPGLLRASAARTTFLVLFATLLVGMIPLDLDDDKSVWFVLALLASQWPVVLSFVRERRPASSARAPAVRIGRSL